MGGTVKIDYLRFKARTASETPRYLVDRTASICGCPRMAACISADSKSATRCLNLSVDEQTTFNGTYQMLNAALAGFGPVYARKTFRDPPPPTTT